MDYGTIRGYGSAIPILIRVQAHSVRLQVFLRLPRLDAGDVLRPFAPLRLEEVREDVLAESLGHDRILLQIVAGLGEVRGKLIDAQAPLLALAHLEDVAID